MSSGLAGRKPSQFAAVAEISRTFKPASRCLLLSPERRAGRFLNRKNNPIAARRLQLRCRLRKPLFRGSQTHYAPPAPRKFAGWELHFDRRDLSGWLASRRKASRPAGKGRTARLSVPIHTMPEKICGQPAWLAPGLQREVAVLNSVTASLNPAPQTGRCLAGVFCRDHEVLC